MSHEKKSDTMTNLEIAMQHAKMLYWEYDIPSSIAKGNKTVQESFGVAEVFADYPECFLKKGFVAEENIETYRNAIEQIRNGSDFVEFEARVKTLHSDFEWVRICITSIKDAEGKPQSAVCTSESITEYKHLENRFMTTLNQNHITNWIYDINRHAIMLHANSFYAFEHDENNQIPNVPESQIAAGLCYPDDVEIFRRLYRRIEMGEKQVEEQLRFMDSHQKEFRWKRCVYTVVEDVHGKPAYAIGSAVDVTEQHNQQQKYEAAVEYRKRTQVENLLLSGHCSLTQNKILEMTDLTGANLLQRFGKERNRFFLGIESLILDENKRKEFHASFTNEAVLKKFEQGIHESELTFEAELEAGRRVWVNIHIDIFHVPESNAIEGFLLVRDITAAHMQEQILNTVVECDYDYVMVVDIAQNTYELYTASKDKSMLNTPTTGNYEEQIRKYADNYALPQDRRIAYDEMRIEYLQNILENQEVYVSQVRLLEEDGSVRYKQARFFYLNEAHTHILVTRIDITDIMKKEEDKRRELTRALETAEQATRAKTEFLSRMSHDLRTPMNVIMGLTALTIDDAKNPEMVCSNMEKLRSTSNFMLSLVNDILDMAKIENGAMELHKEPYLYSDFLMDMKTMFSAQCEQKEIELHFKEPVCNPVFMADKTRLNQIFFNLFSNAVKFTPIGGRIDYTIENLKMEKPLVTADVIISDTGIGMSQEFQSHMFEPFTQEDTRITPDFQGTGLGLSITKQLIEMMGGSIRIESEMGKGTTVIVHLELELIEENAGVIESKTEQRNENLDYLQGKKVLLVEDHPLNAQIARRVLEKEGVNVFYAENGKLAVEKFSASPEGFFQALLMDIRMPEMDGYTACRSIRALKRADAAVVPIIAMTANAYQSDIEESFKAGMNAYLSKPIEPKKLLNVLAEYVK